MGVALAEAGNRAFDTYLPVLASKART